MTTRAVLYHANCPDGFAAAWVAYNALGVDTTLHAVSHGDPPPDLTGVDEVYVVDFSYPHDVLVGLTEDGTRRVVVLDHHRSAFDDITAALARPDDEPGDPGFFHTAGPPEPYVALLDMERSGAGITWDYFHPGAPRPAIVDYVEDRDLWWFKLPDSKAVSAFIRCQSYDLDVWDELAKLSVADMANAGEGVLLHIDAYCRAAANHAYWCEMGGRKFPIVNVPYESCSEVAAYLLDRFETDMASYFFERGESGWQYGFRSRNDVTVHDFAIQFGGGGHEQASGCVVPELAHVRVT